MVKNHFVYYDFHEKLAEDDFGSLFLDRPGQFGYRGDPELWDDLTKYFKGKSLPKTETAMETAVTDAIVELTGKSIHEHDSFFVEKYYHGSGMSGGSIHSEFWLAKAIPILIGRYQRINNSLK